MLPSTATQNFVLLAETYRKMQDWRFQFPELRAITLAQWALETGWGKTELASKYNNFAGMKWREGMLPWASKQKYTAHDGPDTYCNFPSYEHFVMGYWARLELIELYKGWEDAAESGAQAFIEHIGPTWVGGSEFIGKQYVDKVLRIASMRTEPFMAVQVEKEKSVCGN